MENDTHMGNIVFFRSCFDTYKLLDNDKLKLEYLDAILRYSFDEEKEITNPIVLALLQSVKPNIDASKVRYAKSILNGEKGGRPRTIDYSQIFKLKSKGYTQNEISNILNVSQRQIRRILNENIEADITGQKGIFPDISGHNLDIDKDKDIDTYIDIDNDIDMDMEKDKNIDKDIKNLPF